MAIYGAVEAGGTKIICCTGDENGNILNKIQFKTAKPQDNMLQIIDFFSKNKVEALGLGWFGPIDIDKNSQTYGYVLDTPKADWKHFNVVGSLKKQLDIPIAIDTDVNVALLGECTWGSAVGLTSAMYITIGTGIGAGILSSGRMINGISHPEAGHIFLKRMSYDNFEGNCPYHKDCFEGLASGPAIEARWKAKGESLADNIEVWDLEAEYIAQAIYSYMLLLSPQRIILGGGVMQQQQLFPLVHQKVTKYMAGYLDLSRFGKIDQMIIPSKLNKSQGLLGGLSLAMTIAK